MGFGIDVKVDTPKVPKVEVPKVDVAGAVDSVKSAVSGAVSGAVDSAKSAANGVVNSAKDAVSDTVGAVTGAVSGVVTTARESLSTVAGAIADVTASFTGAIEDIVLEPHFSLDANASYEKTKFEKGPIWIYIEIPPAEARKSSETVRLFSRSYDETIDMCDFKEEHANVIGVLFEDAPMNEMFSLEILSDGNAPQIMFTNITYGNLRTGK